MKKFFYCGKDRFNLIFFVLFLFFIFITPTAFASSGEGGTAGWLATDTYRVMNFAVLVIALFFIVRKPLADSLNSRIEGIKGRLTELEEEKAKALRKFSDYEKKFANLNKEAEVIIENYIKQGEEAKARILKEADEVAKKMEETAKRNIDYQFSEAKKELQKEIITESLTKAKELIKSKINLDDQKRLIDEYLNKVVA